MNNSSSYEQNNLSNGWTQYQKLVLAELTRHENAITSLKDKNMDDKLLISQISQNIINIKEELVKIRESQIEMERKQSLQDQKFTTQKDDQDKKFNAQNLDLEKLKWKIGAIVIGLTFVINVAANFIVHWAGKIWHP